MVRLNPKMAKIYRYVGPPDILHFDTLPERFLITAPPDVSRWIRETHQERGGDGGFIATFVINTMGELWIADRHSEHVHCARNGDVLSAGEITFALEKGTVSVLAVTNQSTGFCPEPVSWTAVQTALDAIGFDAPDDFTTPFDFRRCPTCGAVNIVKEGHLVCNVCENDLPALWNFG